MPEDERICTAIGGGGLDTRRCHTAILERGAVAIVPIRRGCARTRDASRSVMKRFNALGHAEVERVGAG